MTTLQLIPHLAPIARTITTVGTVGSEVLTAGAILAALNITSTAIEKTYQAGRFTRRIVDATVIPAADAISWLNAKIDWTEVGATLWGCLLTVATALYVAGEFTGRAIKTAHANWIGTVEFSTEPVLEIEDPRDTIAIEATAPETEDLPFDCSFDGGAHDIDWAEALAGLTIRKPVDLTTLKVVELRKRARGLAPRVHLMRKAELLELLA